MLSDETSSDSESGIRYKTDSTRNKDDQEEDGHRRRSDRDVDRRAPGRRERSRSRDGSRRDRRDRRYSPVRSGHSSRDDRRYRDSRRSRERDGSRDRRKNESHRSNSVEKNSTFNHYNRKDADVDRGRGVTSNRNGDRKSDDERRSCPSKESSSSNLENKSYDTRDKISRREDESSEDEEEQRRKLLLELKNLERETKKKKKSKSKEKKQKKDKKKEKSQNSFTSDDSEKPLEPEMPETLGPSLPQHLLKTDEPPQNIEGPALPPHLTKKSEEPSIGPSVPDDLRKVLSESQPPEYVIDSSESENEDEEIYGPVPITGKLSAAHQKLEERALKMKIDSFSSDKRDDKKSREEWMLELPSAKASHFGFGPRQFRAKEGPDMSDRSMWTDTPEDKKRKAAGIEEVEDPATTSKRLQSEAEREFIKRRDADQEEVIKKHKKKHKRGESLLEIHQRKLEKKKKKEKKETGKEERRPFSRDIDLKVNKFDEAQKNAVLKKAQLLDSRFSSGEAKFL